MIKWLHKLYFLWRATLESNNNYQSVFITVKLSGDANRLLTESCKRSNRKKIQEATLRIEDHLRRFRSISELDFTFENQNIVEMNHGCSSHI